MKKILIIILTIVILLGAVVAWASPPCPQRGDRLEDFAYCLTPVVNSQGRIVGAVAPLSALDPHTASLMQVMNRMPDAPPQINPVVPAVSFASNMAIAYAVYHRYGFIYPYSPFGFWINFPIYP